MRSSPDEQKRTVPFGSLVHKLLEARDDKLLLRLQKQLAKQDLLIVDEIGYLPVSRDGAVLFFQLINARH